MRSRGGPTPAKDAKPREAEPPRLVAPRLPSPFAPGRAVTFARLSGSPSARGLRDGDHVALVAPFRIVGVLRRLG